MKLLKRKKYNIFLLACMLLATSGNYAQLMPAENFYKHFEGHINNTINISANIIKLQDTIYGNYYYWYFEHESNEKYVSRQIPLQGKMTSPTEFVLNEYQKEGSHFDGIIAEGNRLEGTWKNEEAGKSLPFEMLEKYPKGSMSFELIRLTDKKTLNKEDASPTASIDVTALQAVAYPSPSVEDSVKRLLYKAYGKENLDTKAQALLKGIRDEYFARYKEANEEIYAGGNSFDWLKISRQNVVFNQDYILTLEYSNYAFTGGAHGLLVNKYHVIDLTKGEKIQPEDIFIEGYEDKLSLVLNTMLKETNNIEGDKSLTTAGFFVDTVKPSSNFYLHKAGIGFYYNNYEIAPYSAGHIDIFIPYEKIRDLLRPDGIVRRIYDY